MRTINVKNADELNKFKQEISGFTSCYGFPYRLDDLTEKGANYTLFCSMKWKKAITPATLYSILSGDVDADRITIEYVDFVKE